MALKNVAVEGLSVGSVAPDVSINVTPIVSGPGCAFAYSDGLEETKCSNNKAENKLCLIGAQVGRKCPAADAGTVIVVATVKAVFSATAIKTKVDSTAPIRTDDSAVGGVCSCTLAVSPFTPFNMTFTGSIDNAGQFTVKGS